MRLMERLGTVVVSAWAVGDAWASWHKLVPTRVLSGWTRIHAGNTLSPDDFRIGWHESRVRLKEAVLIEEGKDVQVMHASGKPIRGDRRVAAGRQPDVDGEGTVEAGLTTSV